MRRQLSVRVKPTRRTSIFGSDLMGGIAKNGVSVVDGDNVAIQGQDTTGIAIQGQIVYTAIPWELLDFAGAQGSQGVTINSVGSNLIVVFSAYFTGSFSLTDSENNIWSEAISIGGLPVSDIHYCLRPTTSPEHTIALTAGFPAFIVAAFRGRSNDFSPDQSQAVSNPNFTPITLPAITPTVANTLAVTTVGMGYSNAAVDSGFTIIETLPRGTNYGTSAAYLVIPGAASIAPTWTLTGQVSADTTSATLVSFNSSTDE